MSTSGISPRPFRCCALEQFSLAVRTLPMATVMTLVLLSLGVSADDNKPSPPPLSEQLTREGFLAHLDGRQRFRVWGGQGLRQVVELSLIQVDDINLTPQVAQFTAVFRGPDEYPLDKGVYNFENSHSGRFQLFLEAAQQSDQGLIYRVDFNMLRQ